MLGFFFSIQLGASLSCFMSFLGGDIPVLPCGGFGGEGGGAVAVVGCCVSVLGVGGRCGSCGSLLGSGVCGDVGYR